MLNEEEIHQDDDEHELVAQNAAKELAVAATTGLGAGTASYFQTENPFNSIIVGATVGFGCAVLSNALFFKRKTPSPKKIEAHRVISIDFDGCLFNRYYHHPKAPLLEHDCLVIQANKQFLDTIKQDNAIFDSTALLIGSLRQSYEIDQHNSAFNKTESCFSAIKYIETYLETPFEHFLLADVFGDKEDGTSYEEAINPHNLTKYDEIYSDKSKLTILYAQIHQQANKHANKIIFFDFYDDRGNGSLSPIDVLESLYQFFYNYPELIPKNVTLRLHHYEGGDITCFPDIEGTGFIDQHYRKTVQDITDYLKDHPMNHITAIQNITPSMLMQRSPLLSNPVTNASYTSPQKFKPDFSNTYQCTI